MNLVEFLQDLVIQGWELGCEGEKLKYRAPKEVLNSQILAQLKEHKREIIQLLCDRPDILNVYPLAQNQKSLWFLWQLAPHSSAYNAAITIRICSPTDVSIWHQVFQAIVDRHPILRSTFCQTETEAIQRVHQKQEVNFRTIDASNWSEDELKQQVIEAYQQPFDLEKGPVMRVECFTHSEKDYVFLLTIHDIAWDGWSLDLILNELAQLYQVKKNNADIKLLPLTSSYRDYVYWQQQMLSSAPGEKLWSYWQQELAGELPALNLPTDRPRPPLQTYNGASHNFALSENITQKIKELAQQEGVTVYTILLAALQVLLYRYTGQEDILVGSPTRGRSKAEFTPLVGYFVNPVVLRGNLDKNLTFKDFLAQLWQKVLAALAHQDYPFALLVEKLQPHRDPSRSPIFQVFFILQKLQKSQQITDLFAPSATKSQVNWGGLILEPFEIPQQEGQFDVILEMIESSSSLIGSFRYNTDLFNEETITRMAGHFQKLLEEIIANPQQRVSEFPLLTEREQEQILGEWNNSTYREYSANKCLQQLFEEQVARTPTVIAVEFAGQKITYQQLNQRANQLAHYLQSLGVKPEVLVGICVERSLEMMVGLWGILKAGGAYVPLDPTYPQERLAYMLEDSSVSVLLTQDSLRASLPEHQSKLVCLDTDWDLIAIASKENPLTELQPENLAYVIYTSGSTGKPKGVQICHRSVVNFLESMRVNPGLTDADTLNAITTISFDIAALELYLPLIVGAKVIIVPREIATDGEKLLQQLQNSGATVMQGTPATWQMLLTSGWSKEYPLKVFCGGEALSTQLSNQIVETGSQLWNLYGPTEATIWSAIYPVNQQDKTDKTDKTNRGNELIGSPISNTQIYILDNNLQPVPMGVPGELHIGGVGLARGYLNRPQLTQEKFIANPFSVNSYQLTVNSSAPSAPSARLYKTGDLARYLPALTLKGTPSDKDTAAPSGRASQAHNGTIEFLGRIDHQVKIRGFRIELGEIESVLHNHPEVEQAVVIVREDTPGNKQLVAYLVTKSDSLTNDQVSIFLQRQLPNYLVPAAIVILATMPLTPNGKIDRKALPKLDRELTQQQEFVCPTTPTQETIATIFASVLGIEKVSIHGNFFELGGHSLLATQAISRLRQALNRELPLRIMFEYPTVAQLAANLSQKKPLAAKLPQSIKPVPRENNAFALSWGQERLWFLNQLEGTSSTYNLPGAVRLTGNLNIKALQQALSEIEQRHEILRTSLQNINGTPRQVVNAEAKLVLNLVDLQTIAAPEQEIRLQQLSKQEIQTPFDLAEGYLIRAKLIQLRAEESILFLTMHHIISDGWSMGVLFQELSTLYQAYCLEQASPLPQLSIQYLDYAVWQRQWLGEEYLASQLSYWKQQLADAPPLLDLPTDQVRPALQSFTGSKYYQHLSGELNKSLHNLSQQEGVTLFMTLLAAFKGLLSRYTGSEDIVVGSPVAGRNRPEIEPLVGFFLNNLVLRTQLAGNPSFRELLQRVKQVTLSAYENQELPFEKLVEELQPERNLSYHPLFQVWFNLLNLESQELELPELKLELIPQTETASKFDLILHLQEQAGGLEVEWVYNQDLFERQTIVGMATHFQNLLRGIVANPDGRIGNFRLLNEGEKTIFAHDPSLIHPVNSFREFPLAAIAQSIPDRFDQQIRQYPQNLAISSKNYQWTYQELASQANAIAQSILNLCGETAARIALLFEHDAPAIAAIFATLKAGKTYVPLDPSYPSVRLNYIVEDSQATVILTNHKNLALAQKLKRQNIPVLNIDEIDIATQIKEVNSTIPPDALAYILYTSGSTGQPKGVIQNHRNILHFIRTYTNNLHIAPDDNLTLLSSYSFDAAIMDIFGALLNGATLYPFDIKEDGLTNLAQQLQEQKITIYHSTPTVYRYFLETMSLGENFLSQIRLVVLGGEEVVKTDVDLYQKYFSSDCLFINGLGPTESTVTLQSFMSHETTITRNSVPVGYPVEETEILLLNKAGIDGQIYGEIAIKSPYVALGYWQKPELTQKVFLSDPQNQNIKIYRTGDLGRLRTDGSIEFLGRKDFQVKIRGFRIELGEIEAALQRHPQIQQSVVIPREDNPGEKQLVAYLVLSSGSCKSGQIRDFLQEQLPDYMLPSTFVILEDLPLTPSKKIDRRALPIPEENLAQEPTWNGPRNALELQLTQIFKEILKLDSVGVQDNFFELGGHSLLAVRLMAKIQQQFGVMLPLATLFQSSTIEKLATILQQQQESVPWSPLVTIQAGVGDRPLFCIHPAGGNVLCYFSLAEYLGSQQPVYGLQALGLDEKSQPHTKVEEMATYYLQEIKTIQAQGPYLLAGWSFGGLVAFEIAQQLQAQAEQVAFLGLFDTFIPSKIEQESFLKKDDAELLVHLLRDDLILPLEHLRSLKSDEQLLYVIEQAQNLALIPPDFDIAQARRLLKVYKCNSHAAEEYEPQYYSGCINLFPAQINTANLKQIWQNLASQVNVYLTPGNHGTMMRLPNVEILAQQLKMRIK
ncbi:MAG: amino acid adenylation domain-containing protein [Cyanobacteria bacterium P01_F01_bin.143]